MVGRTDPSKSDSQKGGRGGLVWALRECVCVCVRDVFAIYDNILPRLIMTIIKTIFLCFTEIAHTDDFPSTGTRLAYIITSHLRLKCIQLTSYMAKQMKMVNMMTLCTWTCINLHTVALCVSFREISLCMKVARGLSKVKTLNAASGKQT